MTIVFRTAAAAMLAVTAMSPVAAQIDTSKLPRAGQGGLTMGSPLTVTKGGTFTVPASQVAMMPSKIVNGQKLVQSNGKWYSLVASGAGNYTLVASGGGN